MTWCCPATSRSLISKESARQAIAGLRDYGVCVKMVTATTKSLPRKSARKSGSP